MRLIPSFCALACASALPLAAPAQTAAETPAPETAPETAGRTVLDVTASGTLTGLAADALGPDAALTVRLHGPVAFDVDTADFASLEIFADDPAVKLTVSDTAAYDRITAVSIPVADAVHPASTTDIGVTMLADEAVIVDDSVLSAFNLNLSLNQTESGILGTSSEGVTLGSVTLTRENAGSTSMGSSDFYSAESISESGVAVNCQFISTNSSWTMNMPLTLPSGKTWADTYYVTPEIFVCNNAGQEQADPKELGFEVTILNGETIVYETATAAGVAFSGKKQNAQSVKLTCATNSEALPDNLTLQIKVTAKNVGGGTFAGICGVKFGDATPQVISVNFGQTANNISAGNSIPQDATSVGLAPVPGSAWYTFSGTDNTGDVTSFYDGETLVGFGPSVKVKYRASNYWAWDDSNATRVADAFLVSYLDDSDDGASVTISGIPFKSYGVYVYMATDSGGDNFTAPFVNGEQYTAGNGQQDAAQEGSDAFGASMKKTAQLNVNTLYVDNLSGSTLTLKGTKNNRSRGGIAAIQIVNIGDRITAKSITVEEGDTASLGADDINKAVTATMMPSSALTIETADYCLLKVIGPETGTATLKIAADVDFSKIDLSEAANVTLALNCNVSLPVPSEGADALVLPDTITQTEGTSIQVTGTLRSGVKLLTTEQTDLSFSIPEDTAGAYRVAYSAGAYYLLSNGELSATVTGSMDWSALSWSGEGLTEGTTPKFEEANVSLTFEAADDGTSATLKGMPDNNPAFATLKLIGTGKIEGALQTAMTSVRENASVSFTSESASLGTILVNPGATATFPKDTVYDALDNQGTVKVGVLTKALTVESGTFVVTGKSNRGNDGGNTVVKAGARLEISETGRLYAVGTNVHVSTPRVQVYGTLKTREWQWGDTAFGQFAHNTTNMLIDGGSIEFVGDVGIGDGTRGFSVGPGGATLVLTQEASYRKNNNGDANISFLAGAGALTLSGPGKFVLEQTSLGGEIKLSNGATLSGTSSINTLAFGAETVLDASDSAKILTATTLEMPSEEGMVTVKVDDEATAGTVLLKKSNPTAEEAQKFAVTDDAYVTTGSEGFVLGKMTVSDTEGNKPTAGSQLANLLAEAQAGAISDGVVIVELAYGQSGGKPLTAGLAEAGAELFTGITKTETANGTTTVTVAYDFGITGITVNGDDIEVTAKVQSTDGAGYASGTYVNLYTVAADDTEKAVASAAASEAKQDGSVTLAYTGGLSAITAADGTLKFTVKAETEDKAPTNGGDTGMDPLPPDPGM